MKSLHEKVFLSSPRQRRASQTVALLSTLALVFGLSFLSSGCQTGSTAVDPATIRAPDTVAPIDATVRMQDQMAPTRARSGF